MTTAVKEFEVEKPVKPTFQDLEGEYRQGVSFEELCQKYRLTQGDQELLREILGVGRGKFPFFSKGGREERMRALTLSHITQQKKWQARNREIAAQYDEGTPLAMLAEEYGVSEPWMRHILRREGRRIPRRRKGEQ